MSKQQESWDVFTELERRLLVNEPKDALNLRRDRGLLLVAVAGILMTVPFYAGWKEAWSSVLAIVGIVLELCGMVLLTIRQVRDVLPDFVDARRNYAIAMDREFVQHEDVLAWLRGIPAHERERRLRYLESRLERFADRYPLLFGAVDKLGALPLLAAVFLQAQALQTISGLMAVFGVALIILYGMAMWMTRFRLRLLTWRQWLKAAGS